MTIILYVINNFGEIGVFLRVFRIYALVFWFIFESIVFQERDAKIQAFFNRPIHDLDKIDNMQHNITATFTGITGVYPRNNRYKNLANLTAAIEAGVLYKTIYSGG